MHYYTRNIADFNNATRHLTRQERSIYSDLIELQYDLEEPLPDDMEWICRRVLAFTESERTDVERMLNEFFDLVEQGWSNARCESEINHFKEKQAKAKAAGKASGEARRRNKKPRKNNKNEHTGTDVERALNGSRTDVELTNNQEPITNNHNNPPTPSGCSPPRGRRKKTRWPSDFVLDDKKSNMASDYWLSRNRPDLAGIVGEVFDEFKNDSLSKGKTFEDWDRAWVTWYSRAIEFRRPQHEISKRVFTGESKMDRALRESAATFDDPNSL